jgi:hypothetical protein
MPWVAVPRETQHRGAISALIRTGLLVVVIDGFFAVALGALVPPLSTPLRVFQGIASVLLGRGALDGGLATGLIGLLMHFCVAFFWSGLFLLALRNSRALRKALRSWPGAFAVAAVYGMSIWLVMSLLVIPAFVHRPPTIGPKYFILLLGHIPFVALPMVLANRGGSQAVS